MKSKIATPKQILKQAGHAHREMTVQQVYFMLKGAQEALGEYTLSPATSYDEFVGLSNAELRKLAQNHLRWLRAQ